MGALPDAKYMQKREINMNYLVLFIPKTVPRSCSGRGGIEAWLSLPTCAYLMRIHVAFHLNKYSHALVLWKIVNRIMVLRLHMLYKVLYIFPKGSDSSNCPWTINGLLVFCGFFGSPSVWLLNRQWCAFCYILALYLKIAC